MNAEPHPAPLPKSEKPSVQTIGTNPKASHTDMEAVSEETELVNDMTQALEDLVKVWKAIEAIAPKKRYGHLIEKHQALIDRANRLARGEREA